MTPAAGEALARQWCDIHSLTRGVHELTELDHHAHQSWRDPDGEVVVELHRIAGLGHGAPIAAGGEEGYGAAGPWILEAGLSSSLHIARFWGIAGTRRERPRPPRTAPHTQSDAPPWSSAAAKVDVGETIARALRSAGLMP